MKKQDTRSLDSKAQEALRLRAVQACENGAKPAHVARMFGVSRQALLTWREAYRKGGEKELKSKKRGRKKGGSLKPYQSAQIGKVVVHKNPDQLRLPGFLWTRETVGRLIENKFGITLSRWTVGRYLKRWGFTPQKPAKRALEQNPAAVRRWLNQDYPAIRYDARLEGARILWGDEMALRSDDTVGRTWGKRGQTPVVEQTGSRFRCSVLSALSNSGNLYFKVFTESFTSSVFIDFLCRLLKHNDKKVYLIVDNHPVHRSKSVREWLKSQEGKIRLFHLPTYSPELNPDEYLNQDVKRDMGRKRKDNLKMLIKESRSSLRSRQKQPEKVKKYFEAYHVKYAAQ